MSAAASKGSRRKSPAQSNQATKVPDNGDARVRNATQENILMAERYRKEDTVEVSISPMYAAYFGNTMPIVLNGIPVYVPVDGRTYKIPKSYAMEVAARKRKVDDDITRKRRLSNVQENFEQHPGALNLIKPV